MKTCPECQKESADEARYCSHCGASLSTPLRSAVADPQTDGVSSVGVTPPADDESTWRQFIGPKADFYLAKFQRFRSPSGPKFALTWNWAAFIFEPFLWFLYRKMYLYAMVYAIGPVMAFYITHDMSADLVWRIMAGASANYLYYWHIKERLGDIRKQAGFDDSARSRLIHDAGGVQAYVVWVGIGLLVLKFALVAMIFQRGEMDEDSLSTPKPRGVQSESHRIPL